MVVTGHLFGRRDFMRRDSVADLWSGPCRAREEHETCFEGCDCVEEGL